MRLRDDVSRAPREKAGRPAPFSAGNDAPRDPVASLQLVAVEAARPHSDDGLGAVVVDAARRCLDAHAVVVAIWDDDGQLRVLHESGLFPFAGQQLESAVTAIRASGRSGVTSVGSVAGPRTLAALLPPHERSPGVVVVGRSAPFSPREREFLNVLATLSALGLDSTRRPAAPNVRVGDLQIDLEDHEVRVAGRRARLTRSELRILLFLAAEPGRARTRDEILRHLWKTDYVDDERVCDAHISNLRRKIERDPARPDHVVTVRGVGYALRLP
jgi:DNA-binding response OmpR family regulator